MSFFSSISLGPYRASRFCRLGLAQAIRRGPQPLLYLRQGKGLQIVLASGSGPGSGPRVPGRPAPDSLTVLILFSRPRHRIRQLPQPRCHAWPPGHARQPAPTQGARQEPGQVGPKVPASPWTATVGRTGALAPVAPVSPAEAILRRRLRQHLLRQPARWPASGAVASSASRAEAPAGRGAPCARAEAEQRSHPNGPSSCTIGTWGRFSPSTRGQH